MLAARPVAAGQGDLEALGLVGRQHQLTVVHLDQCCDKLVGAHPLGEVAGDALLDRAVDQALLHVPGVDDHLAHPGVGDELGHARPAGLGLGEGVVERDVDVLLHRRPRVELDHLEDVSG